MPKQTCVLGCKEAILFHRFPHFLDNEERRAEWCQLFHINDNKNKQIYACDRHFTRKQKIGNRLLKTSVPDMNLPEVISDYEDIEELFDVIIKDSSDINTKNKTKQLKCKIPPANMEIIDDDVYDNEEYEITEIDMTEPFVFVGTEETPKRTMTCEKKVRQSKFLNLKPSPKSPPILPQIVNKKKEIYGVDPNNHPVDKKGRRLYLKLIDPEEKRNESDKNETLANEENSSDAISNKIKVVPIAQLQDNIQEKKRSKNSLLNSNSNSNSNENIKNEQKIQTVQPMQKLIKTVRPVKVLLPDIAAIDKRQKIIAERNKTKSLSLQRSDDLSLKRIIKEKIITKMPCYENIEQTNIKNEEVIDLSSDLTETTTLATSAAMRSKQLKKNPITATTNTNNKNEIISRNLTLPGSTTKSNTSTTTIKTKKKKLKNEIVSLKNRLNEKDQMIKQLREIRTNLINNNNELAKLLNERRNPRTSVNRSDDSNFNSFNKSMESLDEIDKQLNMIMLPSGKKLPATTTYIANNDKPLEYINEALFDEFHPTSSIFISQGSQTTNSESVPCGFVEVLPGDNEKFTMSCFHCEVTFPIQKWNDFLTHIKLKHKIKKYIDTDADNSSSINYDTRLNTANSSKTQQKEMQLRILQQLQQQLEQKKLQIQQEQQQQQQKQQRGKKLSLSNSTAKNVSIIDESTLDLDCGGEEDNEEIEDEIVGEEEEEIEDEFVGEESEDDVNIAEEDDNDDLIEEQNEMIQMTNADNDFDEVLEVDLSSDDEAPKKEFIDNSYNPNDDELDDFISEEINELFCDEDDNNIILEEEIEELEGVEIEAEEPKLESLQKSKVLEEYNNSIVADENQLINAEFADYEDDFDAQSFMATDDDDDGSDYDDEAKANNYYPNKENQIRLGKTHTFTAFGFIDLWESYPNLWKYRRIPVEPFDAALNEFKEKFNKKWSCKMTTYDVRKSLERMLKWYHRVVKYNGNVKNKYMKYYKKLSAFLPADDCEVPTPNSEECDICLRLFDGEIALQIHKYYRHEIGELPYKCRWCEKSFSDSYKSQRHEKIHRKTRKFFCEKCGQGFVHEGALKKHIQTHEKNDDRICDLCGKKFANNANLKNHRVLHFPPQHKCTRCPAQFHRRTILNRHMKRHLNQRDLICDICGKTFIMRTNLWSHKRTVHSNKKYFKCLICGMEFYASSGLYYHKKLSHFVLEGTIEDLMNRTVHGNKKNCFNRKLSCSQCDITFRNYVQLNEHKRSTHGYVPARKAKRLAREAARAAQNEETEDEATVKDENLNHNVIEEIVYDDNNVYDHDEMKDDQLVMDMMDQCGEEEVVECEEAVHQLVKTESLTQNAEEFFEEYMDVVENNM